MEELFEYPGKELIRVSDVGSVRKLIFSTECTIRFSNRNLKSSIDWNWAKTPENAGDFEKAWVYVQKKFGSTLLHDESE